MCNQRKRKIAIFEREFSAWFLSSKNWFYLFLAKNPIKNAHFSKRLVSTRSKTWAEFFDVRGNRIKIFAGNDDVLQIETKIIERDGEFSFLYPVLVPSKHYLTECLIGEYHPKLPYRYTDFSCKIKTKILDNFFQTKYKKST